MPPAAAAALAVAVSRGKVVIAVGGAVVGARSAQPSRCWLSSR